MSQYPTYHFYDDTRHPTVLSQVFPLPTGTEDEKFYPDEKKVLKYFSNERERRKFGAAQFCSFLRDTIEVEHCLVIPAIVSLRRIPYSIPDKPKQDLYKTATDEGYHAEQANAFLVELETILEIIPPQNRLPLFLRRLESAKSKESSVLNKNLLTIVNGIVTETRISVELSKFAGDAELSRTVREICKSHAHDEAIHSAQFQALGRWLWDAFDERTKELTSNFLHESAISRSVPDIDSLIHCFIAATGRSLKDASKIILTEYSAETMINYMLDAAKPTLKYVSHLNIYDFSDFDAMIAVESKRIEEEIHRRLKKLAR